MPTDNAAKGCESCGSTAADLHPSKGRWLCGQCLLAAPKVYVVLHWVDHGEAKVDSAWSTPEKAARRSHDLGHRYTEIVACELDEGQSDA